MAPAPVVLGDQQWEAAFRAHVADLPKTLSGSPSHVEAAARLRALVHSRLVKMTDVRDAPERFFGAHAILSEFATQLGPGFGIRFTVQFNLFAGTVTAAGSEGHLALLEEMQSKGQLGCFALTEKLAGVNSGLVVETVAEWDGAAQSFVLSTPNQGATKNWISQGTVADYAVVMADLRMGGKSKGPHAFLMRMRDERGALVPGIACGDMGTKTIGNDLDNAWITYDKVCLPKSALLNRYADISPEGQYTQAATGVPNIDMIGQRLYTGRIVIAESAIVFAQTLFKNTRAYSDAKPCWAPGGRRPVLSEIPQLKALYAEADDRLGRLRAFLRTLEDVFVPLLKAGDVPPRALVDVVAAAKVRCIETSIELCHRLKQEVGSYALMAGGGFERTDYLQCCKFAEGDSRILMQKMARDRVATFKKGGPTAGASSSAARAEEEQLCATLLGAMAKGGLAAWDDAWQKVYRLAELLVERYISEFKPPSRM